MLGPGLPTVAQRALAWCLQAFELCESSSNILQTPRGRRLHLRSRCYLVSTALVNEYLRHCSAFICILEACACEAFSAIFCAECLGCLIEFPLVSWRNRLTSTLWPELPRIQSQASRTLYLVALSRPVILHRVRPYHSLDVRILDARSATNTTGVQVDEEEAAASHVQIARIMCKYTSKKIS